jgi:hypothetical protein
MEYNFIAELVLLNSMLISYPCLTFICKYSSYVGTLGGFRKNRSYEKHVTGHITVGNFELPNYKVRFCFYIHSTMTKCVSYVLVGEAIFRLVIT